ncbi:MAG: protein-L-isoaspartate(D-aspartate) O-methyltransferase [Pseudomonadota bacterium]
MRNFIFLILFCTIFMACNSQPPDFAQQRKAMVDKQILWRGIKAKNVLEAMLTVPREEFVPKKHQQKAYADIEVPLGQDQTLDRPYEDAFLMQALDLKPTDRVLEIGTGSGYLTALLSRMVSKVYSIDIVPDFITTAKQRLGKLGYQNIFLKAGDGYLGWPEQAPFDAIVFTTSPPQIPEPIKEQLAENGRLLIPLGGENKFQELLLYLKKDGVLTKPKRLAAATFVPMQGKAKE